MTTDHKPSFSIHELGDYIKVIDEDGRVITASAHVSHKDKYTLICAALNHYYEHSPEEVEKLHIRIIKHEVIHKANNIAMDKLTAKNAALAEAFEDLHVESLKDGTIHRVRKYTVGGDGEKSVWCDTWYGRHVIGMDCKIATTALNKITNDKTK